MVNSSKLLTNSVEVPAIHETRVTQALKMKKPEQILAEVRSKKIAELNMYKQDPNAEHKVEEIEKMLKMMNVHGKLQNTGPKTEGEQATQS